MDITNSNLDFNYSDLHQRTKKKMESLKWLYLNHYTATIHKFWVMWYILRVCLILLKRGLLHDMSKYSKAESDSFKDWTIAMSGLIYGSDEYNQASTKFAKDDEIHYSVNSHHPQYWPCGIADMSPLDRIEMLCDWQAKSRTGIGIIKSIEYNSSKFNYDEATQDGFIRDAREAFD